MVTSHFIIIPLHKGVVSTNLLVLTNTIITVWEVGQPEKTAASVDCDLMEKECLEWTDASVDFVSGVKLSLWASYYMKLSGLCWSRKSCNLILIMLLYYYYQERKRNILNDDIPSSFWPQHGSCSKTLPALPSWPDPDLQPGCKRLLLHY